MRYIFIVGYRTYQKSIRLIVPFFVMCFVYLISMFKLSSSSLSQIQFLTNCLKLGILGLIYFSFASYELVSKLHRVGGYETIMAVKMAEIKLLFAQISVLLLFLIFWFLLITGLPICLHVAQHTISTMFIIHCVIASVLYCFIPGLIGILLGTCLAHKNRPFAYFVFFVVAVLSSPILNQMFSGVVIEKYPIAQFLDWFYLSIPNADWVADDYYGIAIETSRWLRAIFWCLLLITLLMMRFRKNSTSGIKVILCVSVSLSVVCGVCFASRGNDYLLLKDDRPNGLIYGEYNNRELYETEQEVSANFAISEYNMNIVVSDCLDAVVSICVSECNLTQYQFTLYHGYKVETVVDEKGHKLIYERYGNFLDVTCEESTEYIYITYSGNAIKYYANRQGICLPGYFAYYPLPGHVLIWDTNQETMKPYLGNGKTHFRIKVNSDLRSHSNLAALGDNMFEGDACVVSLFGGLIEEKKVGDVAYIYSPIGQTNSNLDNDILKKTWTKLTEPLSISKDFSLEGKKVVYLPPTIRIASGEREHIVVVDDHILVCNIYPTEKSLCVSYLTTLIPDKAEISLLRQLFVDNLYSLLDEKETSYISNTKPDYEDLSLLFKYASSGEITDRDEWSAYIRQVRFELYDLFHYQLSTLGEEYVMKALFEYIMADQHPIHQIDFLYNLGGNSYDPAK